MKAGVIENTQREKRFLGYFEMIQDYVISN